MNRSRSLITLLAVAVVTSTVAAGAALSGGEPPWLKALNARSEALNEKYGLGDSARSTARADSPAWQRALIIRSDALNRKYGLGRYARTPAGVEEPAWLRALMIRSDALNRQYGLGEYAPKSPYALYGEGEVP